MSPEINIVSSNTKISAVAQNIYSWWNLHPDFVGMGKEIVFSIGFQGDRVIYLLFFQNAISLCDLEQSPNRANEKCVQCTIKCINVQNVQMYN